MKLKETNDMWIAMTLQTEALLDILGTEIKVPVAGLAEGCTGVILVFDRKEDAEAYGLVATGEPTGVVEVGVSD